MSVNKAFILGNTGDEIKMHYFEGGGCIGRLPIATNDSYVNKQTGEKVTDTQWHNVVFRGKTAETIEKYVKKGDQIFVEGSIKTRKWQGEDGNDRYSTEIHANTFSFVGSKNEGTRTNQTSEEPPSYDSKGENEEPDLPF